MPVNTVLTSTTSRGAAPARAAFRRKEWSIIQAYRTPRQVQAFLRYLPYNWEKGGETLRTFRGVVRHGSAHCLEVALSAATILEQHGYPPSSSTSNPRTNWTTSCSYSGGGVDGEQ